MEFPLNLLGATICHNAIVYLKTPLCRTTMTNAWLKTRQRHPFLRAKWDPWGFIAKVTENTQPTYHKINDNRQFLEKFKMHSNKEAKFAELSVCVHENEHVIQILGTTVVFLYSKFLNRPFIQ